MILHKKVFFYKKTYTLILPTKLCCILLISLLFSIFALFILNIHGFLAIHDPIPTDTIIIEGWISDYCFQDAAQFIKSHNIKRVFVTGGPIEKGSFLASYHNLAEVGKATLLALEIPESLLIVVPSEYTLINRTYASAMALKSWLTASQTSCTSFLLFSEATHTRRSRMLYKRALGKEYAVGAIALRTESYDQKVWWKSSAGVRSVIDETIAYVYAFLFHNAAKGITCLHSSPVFTG